MADINDIKDVINRDFKSTVDVEWHGLTLKVKRSLSVSEMMSFVNDVVGACFVVDTGEYIPEVKDFVMRGAVLEYYVGLELPSDLAERYDFIYGADIIPDILSNVNSEQFGAMCKAIDKKIDNLANANIEALNKQMSEVANGFKELETKLSQAFSGVDEGTITKVASAIANGSFDESKLVQAFKNDLSSNDKEE